MARCRDVTGDRVHPQRSACPCHSGLAHSLLAELASIEALQLGIAPHGMQRGFAPEKTQQRVAVFTQPAEPLSRPTGVLLGIIPT